VPKRTSSIQVIQDVLRMRKFVITWPHMKYESEKTNS
jgi:CRISPR/Cas system-associated protein Csx1